MTRMSRTERSALCDLALQVGEDQPTLCEGWTVKDLVVHLLVREGSPGAAGILIPALSRLTDLSSRRLSGTDFPVLVERLRGGPPAYSFYAVPKLDAMFNTLEYFVHHEDIRRARADWQPRELPAWQQKLLWKMIRVGGKGLVRDASVGIDLERSDAAERATLKDGDRSVVVRGLPAELVMFVFGRKRQARVELDGPADAVAALSSAGLGI
jgi:uncharacterized protein (TIGR03085 family)